MGGPHNYLTEITLTVIGALMGIESLMLLRLDRREMLHYVAAAFCLVMGAFIALFGFSLVALTIETAAALSRVTELMSILVMPLFLHGIILLTAKGAPARRGIWELAIYLPAVVLLSRSSGGLILYSDFYLDESGVWIGVNSAGGWPTFLYWAYAIGCFLAGLAFLFTWRSRARTEAERRLSRRLNLATILVLVLFCLNMAGNLVYFYRNSPWRDYLLNLFFSLGFYAWIVVYRRAIVAMTGGVADAASAGSTGGRVKRERIRQGLVAMFAQPVLLLDREGRIEHCNQAAAALFAREGSDLSGRPLSGLFIEPGIVAAAMADPAPELRLEALAATGRVLSLSMRSILGEAGLVAGYLCMCSDIGRPQTGERPESSSIPIEASLPPEGIKLPYGEEISSREYEVLFLLAEGLDVDGIAERLFIAPSTVKSHIHHLYQKTGARNRVGLIKLVGAS
jgi:DNA-binding CsgD family transcriptional regulator/PAS domain-containing protein